MSPAARATMLVLVLGAGSALAAPLAPEAVAGRALYREGKGAQPIAARLRESAVDLTATSFPCAQCHGEQGDGTSEGGVDAPPLVWSTLTAPNRRRPAYDVPSLLRAVREGTDPSGHALHAVMPAYALSDQEGRQLVAYLRLLGGDDDNDEGVTTARLRIGAALPLSGPHEETGREVRRALEESVARANREGGAYGRSFELVVEDAADGTLAATRRLVEHDRVLCLVANFQPGTQRDVDDYLSAAAIPSIGPLALSSRDPERPNDFVFQLLPTLGDQAEVLSDYAAATLRRAVVVVLDAPAEREAAAALARHGAGLTLAGTVTYTPSGLVPDEVLARARQTGSDCVLFLGDRASLLALARTIAERGLHLPLLTTSAMLGQDLDRLPEGVRRDLILSHPLPLPEAAAERGEHPAVKALARAAMAVFVEAARGAGRRISRRSLVASLEQLDSFSPGALPPVTFRGGRRVGAEGAYIVRLDPKGSRLVRVSEWLVPQGRR